MKTPYSLKEQLTLVSATERRVRARAISNNVLLVIQLVTSRMRTATITENTLITGRRNASNKWNINGQSTQWYSLKISEWELFNTDRECRTCASRVSGYSWALVNIDTGLSPSSYDFFSSSRWQFSFGNVSLTLISLIPLYLSIYDNNQTNIINTKVCLQIFYSFTLKLLEEIR